MGRFIEIEIVLFSVTNIEEFIGCPGFYNNILSLCRSEVPSVTCSECWCYQEKCNLVTHRGDELPNIAGNCI